MQLHQVPDSNVGVQEQSAGLAVPPQEVMVVSAADGSGVEGLHACIQQMLGRARQVQQQASARREANFGLEW